MHCGHGCGAFQKHLHGLLLYLWRKKHTALRWPVAKIRFTLAGVVEIRGGSKDRFSSESMAKVKVQSEASLGSVCDQG